MARSNDDEPRFREAITASLNEVRTLVGLDEFVWPPADEPPPPFDWRDDLIPEKPVFGIFFGDGQDSRDDIEMQMAKLCQLTRIYHNNWDKSPYPDCMQQFERGTVPCIELELTSMAIGGKVPMQDPTKGSFWKRAAQGEFDDKLDFLILELARCGRKMFVTVLHELDYAPREQGGDNTTRAGSWAEANALIRHVHDRMVMYGVRDRFMYVLNLGGGYSGAGDEGGKWDQIWGVGTDSALDDVIDVFAWDWYDWLGVREYQETRDEAKEIIPRFNRLAWFRRNIPTKPLMFCEWGVSEDPDSDAGQWLLRSIDWMLANLPECLWWIYFSNSYDEKDRSGKWHGHTRRLDDYPGEDRNPAYLGQKWAVLPQIGADTRLT